jgi:hypothetical protein
MSRRPAGLVVMAALLVAALTGCGGSSPRAGSSAAARAPATASAGKLAPEPSGTASAVSGRPTVTSSPPSRGPAPITGDLAGRDWTYIPTSRHVVAVTFDAGANADGVASVLRTLRAERVPATFFLTGNFVNAFPEAAREIAGSGGRIGDPHHDAPVPDQAE